MKIIIGALLVLACNRVSAQTFLDSLEKSNIRDFAPDLFKKLSPDLANARKGDQDAAARLKEYWKGASVTKKIMNKMYGQRNTILHSGYLQVCEPSLFARAEEYYWRAIGAAERNATDSFKIFRNRAAQLYDQIFRSAFSTSRLASARSRLNNQQKTIRENLNLLNGADVQKKAGVMGRVMLPQEIFENPVTALKMQGNGSNGPPPPQHPTGPDAPSAIFIDKSFTDSIRIYFYDRSDNEDDNQVWRSDDQVTWHLVASVGKVDKSKQFFFTDKTVVPDSRYLYKVATYNIYGANETGPVLAYTRANDRVGVWRVQLNITVANLPNADLDKPIYVTLGSPIPVQNVSTYLDYSFDDFQRGSSFTYDLDFSGINQLSDLESLTIGNTVSDDICYIESIELLVDEKSVYRMVYGTTVNSAYRLASPRDRAIYISHDMLRAASGWQALFTPQRTPLPRAELAADGGIQLIIDRDDIRSMVESVMGNLLHRDFSSSLEWRGNSSSSTVSLSRVNATKIHITFRLTTLIEYWPNPDTDISLDIDFSKSCDQGRLRINISSSNFSTNIDSDGWADLKTVGLSEISDVVLKKFADKCTIDASINQNIDAQLPQGVDCSSLQVSVNQYGDLVICCYRI
jgi:hypothetical protein